MLTLTVMLGTMLNAIDSSIVNVAIPYMRGNLGATVEEISWVATGYILANVIITPLTAMICMRFGRRRFYLFSVIGFTLTSLLCGLASNLTMLVVARILQGFTGGALAPLSQSIIRERFEPHEQGTAMGIFGLGVVIGPALGPTFGGWLVDNYSWPSIFFINVPLGIVNVLMVMRYLHDPPYLKREKCGIDVSGIVLLIIGLGAMQLMLEQGARNDWFDSGFILSLLLLSVFGLVLFVWRELTTEQPAVDLSLLGNRNFAAGVLISGMLGMGLFASMFLLPMFLQQLLGYPALDAGLTLIPRSIAMGLTLPLAGRLYNRLGPRILVTCGLLLSSGSFFLMTRVSLDVGYWNLFLIQALQGIGFGMTFVSVSTTALATVERSRMMAASGLYNVFRQVFGSIGIAVSATLYVREQSVQRVHLMADITPYSLHAGRWLEQVAYKLQMRGSDVTSAKLKALHLLENLVTRQAAMLSYNRVYLLLMLLFLATLPLVLLLNKTGKQKGTAANVPAD
jgi:MFS transporter, DHA2 family, multidrug resistance protein